MKETSKTRKIWTAREFDILQGSGIDIGGGSDCVGPNARRFDVEDGDANEIGRLFQPGFHACVAARIHACGRPLQIFRRTRAEPTDSF